jgi:hydrogenase expression/formation protein HypC
MCLGVPGRIIEIDQQNRWAIVERLGVQSKVYTHLVADDIRPGDYLMIHAGQAIGRMESEEAEETLRLIEEIVSDMDSEPVEHEGQKDDMKAT